MDTGILIISHNELMGQLMHIELTLEGYSTLVEVDSIKGFLPARIAQPRLLILDAAVPDLSEIEICSRLRTTSAELKIKGL